MEDTKLLQEMTDRVLAEAPKKKGKGKKNAEKDAANRQVQPGAYSYSQALDFAPPLGDHNLYKAQGHVNWGPHTGVGPYVDDTTKRAKSEQSSLQSAWEQLSEAVTPADTWGKALVEMGGACDVSHEDIDEKKVGFKKLAGKLSHEKGVEDPKALAAEIGRKKYGAKAFAARVAKGHK